MDKQQTIKKMVETLSSASQASAKYFHEEVKKVFKNGEKHLSRRDGKLKSVLEFQAEALVSAGIGDLQELGERIKLEFYKQFDELIPSIMSDKIDAIIKEMCGK